MKKIFLLLILSILFNSFAFAQSTAVVSKIIQKGQRFELTVTAEKPFYVGGNIHILHIGKQSFSLSKQVNMDGKGAIIFYISTEEFNSLNEGDYIWMSYGNKFKKTPATTEDPAKFCRKNSKTCWALGKFNKQLSGN
jgi:hypothetical protein